MMRVWHRISMSSIFLPEGISSVPAEFLSLNFCRTVRLGLCLNSDELF
jgi:hypothetical protein